MNFSPTFPADITICNDGNVPQSYSWFVTPLRGVRGLGRHLFAGLRHDVRAAGAGA
jgi:hypothetical protein